MRQDQKRAFAVKQSLQRRRKLYLLLSPFFLISLIFAAIQLNASIGANNSQITVQIGRQQTATLDLRQHTPISPYLYGVNVFPRDGSTSLDMPFSGFMQYTPYFIKTIQDMHIKLLRYPGGNWGEQHILSLSQLSDFSQTLIETGSEGMLQAHLAGPVQDQQGNWQPSELSANLNSRALLASRWVDYMNNPHSSLRTGAHAHDPYHPVKFWTVGNEPDLSTDPLTQQVYTVTDYVNAFIQFSLAMHQSDPTIKIFGPEISQFYGVGAGPVDAQGQRWMDDFLKGIARYEQLHPALPYHILDGVSFHRYQFDNAQVAPGILLSSSNEWGSLLTPLRELIKRDFGRDLPISLSEVNTNPGDLVPTRGLAALWWANTLGGLMNQQIEQVAFFSASGVEKPYPLFTNDGLHMTAMAWVMQLFSHLQHNLVPLSIPNEPVSVYATCDDTAQTISFLFINTSPLAQEAQIRPAAFSAWHYQAIRLAPYSIIITTMHRESGAESYRFITTSGDAVAATPVTYTRCETSNAIPANDKPC
ncbi:MAG TPA: hypothetical protein VFU49_05020, partial [Ktedonobacteraceae bacterium]|nr:hypothetical protein [Ktedonobacteraceae bacterium]